MKANENPHLWLCILCVCSFPNFAILHRALTVQHLGGVVPLTLRSILYSTVMSCKDIRFDFPLTLHRGPRG